MPKIETFRTPDGGEITGEVKGTEGKPSALVWRHRAKIAGLVFLVVFFFVFPFVQFCIPRDSAFSQSPTSEVESPPTLEVVQFQSQIVIEATSTPEPSPSPTLILPTSTIPPTARPQILVTGECLVLDFPSEDGQPVGSFVLGSVVYPVGVWSTSQAWYLVEGGWLSPGCTDTPLVGGSFPSSPRRCVRLLPWSPRLRLSHGLWLARSYLLLPLPLVGYFLNYQTTSTQVGVWPCVPSRSGCLMVAGMMLLKTDTPTFQMVYWVRF